MTDNDMVTVKMRVDVEIKVPRQSWADEWDAEPHKVNTDVREYITHNVVEGWTSKGVTDCGGTFTATVVERPRTLLVVDGHELHALVDELATQRTRRGVYKLRVEPRREGLAYKINEGAWSATIGRRVEAD